MKVAVVGGGPSGMFCSAMMRLKCKNISVDLFEKNNKVGKKLNITGKGRCNITNSCDIDDFMQNVVSNKKFCYTMLNMFSPEDTINFFEGCNVPLKIERGNRVFPMSDSAFDITDALRNICVKNQVNILLNSNIDYINSLDDGKFELGCNKKSYVYDKVVIATGGCSYKLTGSTGDGYKFAKSLGHNVVQPVGALCPIVLTNDVSSLQGLSLKNVTLNMNVAGKNKKSVFGDIMFTDKGISGPIALTISSYLNRFQEDDVQLFLDLKPAIDEQVLEARIVREVDQAKNKSVKHLLKALMPSSLADYALKYLGFDENLKLNSFTKTNRQNLIKFLKHFDLQFGGLYDINTAIITAGGVNTNEINSKSMESKVTKGLYFVGEVVDVDCLTGGFNLQFALSSAHAAACDIVGGCDV